jgi:uncharacterized membrane protein
MSSTKILATGMHLLTQVEGALQVVTRKYMVLLVWNFVNLNEFAKKNSDKYTKNCWFFMDFN